MINSFFKTSLPALALVSLAACGGTGGSLEPTLSAQDKLIIAASDAASGISDNSGTLSFNQIANIAKDVNSGYNAVDITPKANVPASGFAEYKGAVGGDLTVGGNAVTVGGLMSMGADFKNNRVGGSLGNFVTNQGERLSGTLAVTNGTLNRTSNSQQVAIFADVDGTLTSGPNSATVDARLRNSGFKGPNAEFVGGDIEGTVRGTGGDGTIDLRAQLVR